MHTIIFYESIVGHAPCGYPYACRTGALSKAGIVMISTFMVIHLYGESSYINCIFLVLDMITGDIRDSHTLPFGLLCNIRFNRFKLLY